MNRASGSVVLSLFALILCGCGSTKPIHYYTIQSSTAPALSPAELVHANLIVPHAVCDRRSTKILSTTDARNQERQRWSTR